MATAAAIWDEAAAHFEVAGGAESHEAQTGVLRACVRGFLDANVEGGGGGCCVVW